MHSALGLFCLMASAEVVCIFFNSSRRGLFFGILASNFVGRWKNIYSKRLSTFYCKKIGVITDFQRFCTPYFLASSHENSAAQRRGTLVLGFCEATYYFQQFANFEIHVEKELPFQMMSGSSSYDAIFPSK